MKKLPGGINLSFLFKLPSGAAVRENHDITEYAKGNLFRQPQFPDESPNPNGFVTNRLPLWVRADSSVSLQQVMAAMRDHFEDTPLDMRFDFGAGPFHLPYRWRPLEYHVDSIEYCHERAIATQQTGYSFVAQSRNWLPDPLGGIYWFGVDDAAGCVYAPMYCGIREIPSSYAVGNGSMVNWSETSAFWTFNQVNNWAYTRYELIHPEIAAYQHELETRYIRETEIVDAKCMATNKENPSALSGYITDYSGYTGNLLVSKWKSFYHFLFMKYMDGNVKQTSGFELLENGNGKGVPRKPAQPGYGKEWERRMASDNKVVPRSKP
ncbi:MAG: C69 family dipeptidase [Bacteroidota bacterium]